MSRGALRFPSSDALTSVHYRCASFGGALLLRVHVCRRELRRVHDVLPRLPVSHIGTVQDRGERSRDVAEQAHDDPIAHGGTSETESRRAEGQNHHDGRTYDCARQKVRQSCTGL